MTLVSIITPSLNQAAFIRQTMESVLNQDYTHLEYLVVDGGSSDGSVDIIRQYSERIAWWSSQPDSGQAEAINEGIAHAHGEIVAWLNSDDCYLPGAVSAAVRVLNANRDAVFVYGNMRAIDASDQLINLLRYPQVTLRELLCFSIIGQPAVFIRRTALDTAGALDPRFHLLLDHQLWLRLGALGPMIHCDETWAAARYHASAKNIALAGQFGSEAFQILKWAAGQPNLAPVLQSVHRQAVASAYRVDARYLLDAGIPGRSLRSWLKAFSIHPPTALRRLNLLGSALLQLLGLGAFRRAALQRRREYLRR